MDSIRLFLRSKSAKITLLLTSEGFISEFANEAMRISRAAVILLFVSLRFQATFAKEIAAPNANITTAKVINTTSTTTKATTTFTTTKATTTSTTTETTTTSGTTKVTMTSTTTKTATTTPTIHSPTSSAAFAKTSVPFGTTTEKEQGTLARNSKNKWIETTPEIDILRAKKFNKYLIILSGLIVFFASVHLLAFFWLKRLVLDI
ncbi:unnamed protein product [Caenorhabditis auriculariae]|uniref:Uncharacterized protein n=1 Tax=Caenorhabditis auriculariae TaxID=2777116 RepID=A0A8S1HJ70_9PELO|nr:unnamed protein product [Caenorhabditis auriculariae]